MVGYVDTASLWGANLLESQMHRTHARMVENQLHGTAVCIISNPCGFQADQDKNPPPFASERFINHDKAASDPGPDTPKHSLQELRAINGAALGAIRFGARATNNRPAGRVRVKLKEEKAGQATHREHGSSLLPDGHETMLPPFLFTSTRESSPNTHSQSMVFPLRTSHVIGSLSFFRFGVFNRTMWGHQGRANGDIFNTVFRCGSFSHHMYILRVQKESKNQTRIHTYIHHAARCNLYARTWE